MTTRTPAGNPFETGPEGSLAADHGSGASNAPAAASAGDTAESRRIPVPEDEVSELQMLKQQMRMQSEMVTEMMTTMKVFLTKSSEGEKKSMKSKLRRRKNLLVTQQKNQHQKQVKQKMVRL